MHCFIAFAIIFSYLILKEQENMLVIDKNIRQLYEITDDQVREISKYDIKQDITLDSLCSRDDIDTVKQAFSKVIGYDINLLIDLLKVPDVNIDEILKVKERIAISDPDYNVDDIVSSFISVENGTAAQDLEDMFKEDNGEESESLIYFKIPSKMKDIEEVVSSRTVMDILDVDTYNDIRVNSLSFMNSGVHPSEELYVPIDKSNMSYFLSQINGANSGVISFLLPTTKGGVKLISSVFSVEEESLYVEKSESNFIINSPYLVSRQFSIFILGMKNGSMVSGMWNWNGTSYSGVKKDEIINFDKSIGLDKVFSQDINANIIDFISTQDIDINDN